MVLLHEEDELGPELVVLASFNLQGLLELLDARVQGLHAVVRHGSLVSAHACWATHPSKRFPYSFGPLYLVLMLLEELSLMKGAVKACRLGAYG